MTEVTCAIIMDGDRVLAARRSAGMPHPLKWEFPGGKIRKGESPGSCIRREIQEEMGVVIRLTEQLDPVVHHYGSGPIRLIPFICTIEAGSISPLEHSAIRWLAPGELDEPDWLDADVGVVRILKKHLSGA